MTLEADIESFGEQLGPLVNRLREERLAWGADRIELLIVIGDGFIRVGVP